MRRAGRWRCGCMAAAACAQLVRHCDGRPCTVIAPTARRRSVRRRRSGGPHRRRCTQRCAARLGRSGRAASPAGLARLARRDGHAGPTARQRCPGGSHLVLASATRTRTWKPTTRGSFAVLASHGSTLRCASAALMTATHRPRCRPGRGPQARRSGLPPRWRASRGARHDQRDRARADAGAPARTRRLAACHGRGGACSPTRIEAMRDC